MQRRYLQLACGLVLALACGDNSNHAPAVQTPTPSAALLETLAGNWTAELRHNGTTARLGLELRLNGARSLLRGFVTIPAIDLWDYALGAASVAHDTVRIGSFELRHHADEPRLVGIVPPSFVPEQTIALELRPGERIARPEPRATLPEPERLWSYETGGPVWAGVIIDDHGIYVGSDDGSVHALDRDGKLRFRVDTNAPVRAEPLVHLNAVLVHSDDGFLYRVDAETGETAWRAQLAEVPTTRLAYGASGFRYDHYQSAPRVDRGVVYVGHERQLVALEFDTGAVWWTRELPDSTTSSPALAGGRLYAGCFDGNVYALDAHSGETLWTYDTNAPVPSSPIVHKDHVIVGSRSYDLLALDVRDGSRRWSFYNWFSWIESSPVIMGDMVYVGSSDEQNLHALDASSGALAWKFDTDGSAWSRPAVSSDLVVIGAVGVAGYLVDHQGGLFAVDRETGDGLWHVPSPPSDGSALWGFGASSAIDDGIVVAADLDGKVYAFRAR